MKRKYILAAAICLSICALAGCQETPKESIVREKGADSIKNYQSEEPEDVGNAGDAGNAGGTAAKSLRESLGAPEHYKNQESYEDGRLVIETDAEVILPEVSSMNTYAVAAKEVNQELIDHFTKAFFEGDKVYHMYSYTQWTKEDYQKDITNLKKYKAEGNLDPYEYGKDENGELYYDIDAQIARDEEEMKSAPDEVVKEEVKPAFGIEWVSSKGSEEQTEVDKDSFWGMVETSHGVYSYQISYGLAPDLTVKITKRRDDVQDSREFTSWIEGEYLLDAEGADQDHMSEETMQKLADISLADAQKAAEEAIDRLGWDWKVYGWDYALFSHGENGTNEDTVLDGGYYFHFARVLDGVPVTFTSSYGGGLEDMDSTLTPWSYERCEVIVGDDGIQEVEIMNPYEVGEVQTEHVKLMDFDSIIKIYEQMMEVTNADMADFEKQRTFHIRKIVLGYSRIYDPTTDSDTGLMVPVWDFFGGFDVETDEGYDKNNGEHATRSFMTINAIDGTVIDRELGY